LISFDQLNIRINESSIMNVVLNSILASPPSILVQLIGKPRKPTGCTLPLRNDIASEEIIMNKGFAVFLSAGVLAGCATNPGPVTYKADGTPVYTLDERPWSTASGEGALMPGAFENGEIRSGQFTGQERTHARIGQFPVIPPDADAREVARDPAPPPTLGAAVISTRGAGAGTLGQSGIVPGQPVSSSTIMTSPAHPGLTSSTVAPTSDTANNRDTAAGAPAPAESGTAHTDIPSNTTRAQTTQPTDELQDLLPTVTPNLADRVHQALAEVPTSSSAPVQDFEIDVVEGNITLRGLVRSEAEKSSIGEKAAQVPGVRSVVNQLKVIPAPPGNIPIPQTLPSSNPHRDEVDD
jgi:hypothetical protein